MGRQEELATISSTTLGSLIEVKIAEEIETVARELRIADQLCVVNRELVGKPSNTIDFYKRGAVQATAVDELAEAKSAEHGYEKIETVTVGKQAATSAISHEAIRDGRMDLVNDVKVELGEAMANRKDLLIFRDGAFDSEEGTSKEFTGDGVTVAFTFDQADLGTDRVLCDAVAVIETTKQDIVKVNAKTRTVTLKEAPASNETITITPYLIGEGIETYTWKTGTDDTFITNINAARARLIGKKQWPDTLVATPNQCSTFITQAPFTDVAKYGDIAKQAMLKGEIGRVYDLQTIPSTIIPEGLGLVLRRKTGIVHIEKEPLRVTLDEIKKTDSTEVYAWETYGNGCKNTDTVLVLLF